MNDWNAIRAFYRKWEKEILFCKNEWADGDPYLWDHEGGIRLTPIERWLWHDIREVDAVLYPQYPVGRFFVDFANPRARVAIECDGAQWHQDKAKDRARDLELLAEHNWTVYRITGSECRTDQDADTGKSGYGYEFIKNIAETHGLRR